MKIIPNQRAYSLPTASLYAALLLSLTFPSISSATTLGDLAAAMQPGEWRTLNTNNDGSGFSGNLLAVEPPANILQFADKGMWNPNTRQVFFIGEGHIASGKFISYTEASHRWQIEPKPPWDCAPGCNFGSIGHAYHHSTINPATGDIYVRLYNSNAVHKYTKATNSWAQIASLPVPLPVAAALEYFPEMGGLVAVGAGTVLFYRVSTGQWSVVRTGLAMGPYHSVAYYNAANRVVLFGGGNNSGDLYKIDAAGTVTKVRDAPISFGINVTINAVDPITGRLLVFRSSSAAYEYDPAGNTWNQFNPGSAPFSGSNPVADTMATAISTHGVVMLVRFNGDQSRTYLYKHAPGTPPPPDNTPPGAPLNVQVQ